MHSEEFQKMMMSLIWRGSNRNQAITSQSWFWTQLVEQSWIMIKKNRSKWRSSGPLFSWAVFIISVLNERIWIFQTALTCLEKSTLGSNVITQDYDKENKSQYPERGRVSCFCWWGSIDHCTETMSRAWGPEKRVRNPVSAKHRNRSLGWRIFFFC